MAPINISYPRKHYPLFSSGFWILNSGFRILTTVFCLLYSLNSAHSQPAEVMDAAKLQLVLKKLTVLGSVLLVGAHPDDENTAFLAYAANEKLVRAAYLAITRGDGGQNLIGSEQDELLGVIRTQELLAARRIDGAEQFFTRAIDFGYSKSPDESLEIWGKEKILGDVVWVIRKFRPDVILTRFPKTGEGGHGHHTASSILAEEAFHAAADPAKFPEQLKWVQPWQAKRILWNGWLSAFQQRKEDLSKLLKLDVGDYNPLLGKSYTEISAESRSMHKSQGFGATGQRGETLNYFSPIAGEEAKQDLFDGIDLSWDRVKNGTGIKKLLEQAYKTYQPENPAAILPLLIQAYQEMNKLTDTVWIPVKQKELAEVIRSCSGMWIEAMAADYSAVPGSKIKISASLINRSTYPLTLKKIEWPFQSDTSFSAELKKEQSIKIESTVPIPGTAEITQPYWLKDKPGKGAFEVADQTLIGLPEDHSALKVTFTVLAGGQSLVFQTPVLFRWTDPVKGEQYRSFGIVPPVTIHLEEKVYLFPERKAKDVRLVLKSATKDVSGKVKLNLPPGWQAQPDVISFRLKNKNDEAGIVFSVKPPAEMSEGTLTATAETNDGLFSKELITVSYPHIPIQTVFPPAQAKLVRLDIKKDGNKIGYIEGSGDDIPRYLNQLGYQVTILTDTDIDNADLSAYDVILTGIRAYNTRPRLIQQQARLLEYINKGGMMVVQYNTVGRSPDLNIGPYPFQISRDRVSVEEAPVTFLVKDHPLLNHPNRITQKDFDGWVQERGLYFSDKWDPLYQTILSCNDPNEPPKNGGLLYARYGKGVYIYTAYSWSRQLPAGVPGAYRIFVNLISAGKGK